MAAPTEGANDEVLKEFLAQIPRFEEKAREATPRMAIKDLLDALDHCLDKAAAGLY